jgi:hypothetical protein
VSELDPPDGLWQGYGVISPNNDRPYFDAWLRRTGRQFAVSGRLTETAMALAAAEGGTVDEWRARLRDLLEGGEMPSIELLTRIDALLAGPAKGPAAGDSQGLLF